MMSNQEFLEELERAVTPTPADKSRAAARAAELAEALSRLGMDGSKAVRLEKGEVVVC